MPEGDTIFRLARRLGKALTGQTIVSARSQVASVDAESLIGHAVARVESRGKSLLVHLDDGRILHTHMKMTGSWGVYLRGEPWRKSASLANLVITTSRVEAVCFAAPIVELLSPWKLRHHPYLSRLGPDLLGESAIAAAAAGSGSPPAKPSTLDIERARMGLRSRAGETIADALLRQSAVAGIGNVYKSEVLFVEKVDPFCLVGTLDDATLDRLLARARTLLRRNVGRGPRRTRFGDGPRLWVYERSGEGCLVCGETVRMRRVGENARSTYFCASCQGVR